MIVLMKSYQHHNTGKSGHHKVMSPNTLFYPTNSLETQRIAHLRSLNQCSHCFSHASKIKL